MRFEKHSELEGVHAFLSPSNYHWVNYSKEKLVDRYLKKKAVERGTELHEYAAKAIELMRKQPKNKDTVNMYINDAIGFDMTPEQPLIYSGWCSGTADSICYRNNALRIHDLKTGETEADMLQLKIYAALFCLNYQASVAKMRASGMLDIDISRKLDVKTNELHFDPAKMSDIILRIYQYNDIKEEHPSPDEIQTLMDIIVEDVNILNNVVSEE